MSPTPLAESQLIMPEEDDTPSLSDFATAERPIDIADDDDAPSLADIQAASTAPEDKPQAQSDPYAMETPFDCFKRPDVMETLRSHPQTRPYSLDSGLMATIEKLRVCEDQQQQANLAMSDPRLMQAMGVLQGWGLKVEEKDVKHAESVGDMPKRDAVQLLHYEYAYQFKTPQEAKDAGNVPA